MNRHHAALTPASELLPEDWRQRFPESELHHRASEPVPIGKGKVQRDERRLKILSCTRQGPPELIVRIISCRNAHPCLSAESQKGFNRRPCRMMYLLVHDAIAEFKKCEVTDENFILASQSVAETSNCHYSAPSKSSLNPERSWRPITIVSRTPIPTLSPIVARTTW